MAKTTTNVPTFDEFWKAYPLHKARKQAEQAWARLTATDRRAALAALPAYRQDCEQQGIAFKYAQGWLNGRRWEDELEAQVPSGAAATFEHPRQTGSCVSQGASGTNPEHFAQPLPSHPRGGAGVGSETSPTPPSGMEKWGWD
ncbi:MAG: hypothetical protein IJV24_07325 [Prevotella sp.]|nr:hypothetical protein [Prevotella sp.]